MGEGEGTSQALRPPGVALGRWAAKGCPGLSMGVPAAQAGDLPFWNASADLQRRICAHSSL